MTTSLFLTAFFYLQNSQQRQSVIAQCFISFSLLFAVIEKLAVAYDHFFVFHLHTVQQSKILNS